MEKDSRRRDRFNKSKKYLSKNPNKSKKFEGRNLVRSSDKREINREINREIAHSTLKDSENGYYEYRGNKIRLLEGHTRYYSHIDIPIHVSTKNMSNNIIYSENTTIKACKEQYFRTMQTPCALVFASAKKPGGGWLNGADAQEESIARCSCLYTFLSKEPKLYKDNLGSDGFYTDGITYCESVPIFKNEEGDYEAEVCYANFLACPAVNVNNVKNAKDNAENIRIAMKVRIDNILNVMYREKQTHIILGAYGCGVFGNDPQVIAGIFSELLNNKYIGVFDEIIFAIPDEAIRNIFQREIC